MIGTLQAKVARLQDTEVEVKQLRETLADYNEEFRQVRNQGKRTDDALLFFLFYLSKTSVELKENGLFPFKRPTAFVDLFVRCSPVQIQEPVSVDNAPFLLSFSFFRWIFISSKRERDFEGQRRSNNNQFLSFFFSIPVPFFLKLH